MVKKLHYFIFDSKVHLFSYLFKFSFYCFISLVYFLHHKPDFVVTIRTHTAAVPMCFIAHFFQEKSYLYRNTFQF